MALISTRDLSGMPDIPSFRRLTRSLAMLDAILAPEWEDRYYSFDSHWAPGELLASMRNGQGDDWFAVIAASGIVIIGLDHEASMYRPDAPWPGLFDALPKEFTEAVREPAFDAQNSTFCIWRRTSGSEWEHGPVRFPSGDDPDGSANLLKLLDGRPESYCEFAADYHGRDLPLEVVRAVYHHEPLTDRLLLDLRSEVSLAELAADAVEIGYPGRE